MRRTVAQLDVGLIYEEPSHQFGRTWVMLTNTEQGEVSVTGYLKVTLTVLGQVPRTHARPPCGALRVGGRMEGGGGAEVLTPSSRSMGVAPPTVTQGDEARIPIPREDEDDNIVAGILRPTGAELETVDMAIRVYHATDVPQSAWRPRRRASLARA